METVLLLIHLIITLALIGVVLLQRSEGGGLGMGGGGGAMTGRQAATAMTKLTWALGVLFLANSVALTILAAQNAAGSSVTDLLPPDTGSVDAPVLPSGESLLPPTTGDAPLTPPRAD
ncbi:preprotein translocase subunit SecG [Jannaschia seohaensis]|uniref:Protein-export membrane protein SecG n=1 Tax=Jannaschia seohaensis TaxID=475081 RepID=A0A2Y9ARL3_9RHOB|nr:preprotein translocase subunit SecG [Jannaschia seohaensis]PWJ18201.1 preprotein translocase subunit SecG [Jannaschia seohaensis]SSA46726.1 preprotein translocase subunit SecG [Jannaschia seohaensis]